MKSHCLLSFISFLLGAGSAVAQEPLPLYNTASFFTEDAALTVRVNGFPLLKMPQEGNQQTYSGLLGAFLKRGGNEIVIEAMPLPDAGGGVKPSHLFSVEVFSGPSVELAEKQLVKVERNRDRTVEEPNCRSECLSGGNLVGLLRVNGNDCGGTLEFRHPQNEIRYVPAAAGTDVTRLTLDLPRAPLENLPWLSPPVPLDDAERAAIRKVVIELDDALRDRNWDRLALLLDTKYERLATAGGIAKCEVVTDTRATLAEVFASPGFALQPLLEADLTIVEFPGLNLVRIEKAGTAPIAGSGTDYDYEMPVYLSKVGVEWKVVE